MPEHYEVKRIANYLIDSGILNQTLQGVAFKNKGERIIANSSVNQLINLFLKNRLINIAVKGKYTGFEFEFGTVIIHYRFTGIPHIQGRSYQDRLYTIFSFPPSVVPYNLIFLKKVLLWPINPYIQILQS